MYTPYTYYKDTISYIHTILTRSLRTSCTTMKRPRRTFLPGSWARSMRPLAICLKTLALCWRRRRCVVHRYKHTCMRIHVPEHHTDKQTHMLTPSRTGAGGVRSGHARQSDCAKINARAHGLFLGCWTGFAR